MLNVSPPRFRRPSTAVMTYGRVAAAALVAVVVAACSSGTDAPFSPPPPFAHSELYVQMQEHAQHFTLVEHDYKEDFGDGALYGLAYAARASHQTGDETLRTLAQGLYGRNLHVATTEHPVTGDSNELFMSLLGVLEYMQTTGDFSDLEKVDKVINNFNELLTVVGHYIAPGLAQDSWAMQTYGPVSLTGLVALMNLQRAVLTPGAPAEPFIHAARQMVASIEKQTFADGVHRFSSDKPGLYLYPNVTMMLVNLRLEALTGEKQYGERALQIYEGTAPLLITAESGLAGPGRRRSPYSQKEMGAATDDYSTLSSQNYLIMALYALYQYTGDAGYVAEADRILDFIQDNLMGQWCLSEFHRETPSCGQACAGRSQGVCVDANTCEEERCQTAALHHWIDGRNATSEDRWIVCTGCNLQLLYVLWYRQYGLTTLGG